MYTVYMRKFPNNKVYIGLTSKKYVKKRWSRGNGYKNQQFMWRAIQKYGWDNIEHIIVAENLTKEEACSMEIDLIQKYKSDNSKYGYNIYKGGDLGKLGIPMSAEIKEKLRKVNSTREKTPQEIAQIKKTLAEYWTPEVRAEFGKQYGGNGFLLDENTAIHIYDRLCNGENRTTLANEYNVSKSVIDRIAQKKYYAIRNSTNPILQRTFPIQMVYQYDLEGNFLHKYNTIQEASMCSNLNEYTIRACCKHRIEKSKHYKWYYVLILDNGKEIIL